MNQESSNKDLVFLSGFGWSGSGAVVDWLCDSGCFAQPGVEQEILAINYGICHAIRSAQYRDNTRLLINCFCASPSFSVFIRLAVITFVNAPFMAPWRLFISLPFFVYWLLMRRDFSFRLPSSLRLLLGNEDAVIAQYSRQIELIYQSIACDIYQRSGASGSGKRGCLSGPARRAFSKILNIIAEHSGSRHIVMFDNAIPAADLECLTMVDHTQFRNLIVIAVNRDPRDQFLDQSKHSVATGPFSYRKFIVKYRRYQGRCDEAIRQLKPIENVSIFQISFEDFVLNNNKARSRLRDAIASIIDERLPLMWGHKVFRPDESRKNIGIWRREKHRNSIRTIAGAFGLTNR